MTSLRLDTFGVGPLAAALTLSIVTTAASATPAQAPASARDGVFSKEQVERGREEAREWRGAYLHLGGAGGGS